MDKPSGQCCKNVRIAAKKSGHAAKKSGFADTRAREKQEKQEKKARRWTSAVDMGAPALRAVGLSRRAIAAVKPDAARQS